MTASANGHTPAGRTLIPNGLLMGPPENNYTTGGGFDYNRGHERTWLILIGVAAGVFAGLFGIGGGIIIVPSLILLAGFPWSRRRGRRSRPSCCRSGSWASSLITGPRSSIYGLRPTSPRACSHRSWWEPGWPTRCRPTSWQKLFALFCLYVSSNFIDPVRRYRKWRGLAVTVKPEPRRTPPFAWPLIGIGLLAGVMAGMFGIGGGNVIVPLRTSGPPLSAEKGHRHLARGHPLSPSASPG